MRDKLFTIGIKMGLILLLLNALMFIFVKPNTPEWIITWISIGLLLVFETVLIIVLSIRIRRQKNE